MNYIESFINALVNLLNVVGIKATYNETFFFIAGVITPYFFALSKNLFVLPAIKYFKRYTEKKHKYNVFQFVKDQLFVVKFFSIYPPIDIINESERIQINISKSTPVFRIAPQNVDNVIKEIVRTIDKIDVHSPHYHEQIEFYKNRFQEGNFSDNDQFNLDTTIDNFEVFNSLIKNSNKFEAIKKQVLISYLTKKEGFHFNGWLFQIDQMIEGRNHDEEEIFEIITQKTDYYSFRVISELANDIYLSSSFSHYFNNFHEYIGDSFQKNIHLGFGVSVILNTLKDNSIIITKRSSHAFNNSGEAGKYFMSANEGINMSDINQNRKNQFNPLIEIVKRSLDEEIVGITKSNLNILTLIKKCYCTGVFLYLPNMTINLCFYVSIDCHSSDIRDRYQYARDSGFETSEIIFEKRADKKTGLPKFSNKHIFKFLKQTIGNRPPNKTWDEGALATLILSTNVKA